MADFGTRPQSGDRKPLPILGPSRLGWTQGEVQRYGHHRNGEPVERCPRRGTERQGGLQMA